MLKFEKERKEEIEKREKMRMEITRSKVRDMANNYQKASKTRILRTQQK